MIWINLNESHLFRNEIGSPCKGKAYLQEPLFPVHPGSNRVESTKFRIAQMRSPGSIAKGLSLGATDSPGSPLSPQPREALP
jgi:hypothetical protein